jgi:hypothetical protein
MLAASGTRLFAWTVVKYQRYSAFALVVSSMAFRASPSRYRFIQGTASAAKEATSTIASTVGCTEAGRTPIIRGSRIRRNVTCCGVVVADMPPVSSTTRICANIRRVVLASGVSLFIEVIEV